MSTKDPPQAPNPVTTIQAQEGANSQSALQTAELNRVSQTTPYGSINYSTNGTYADGTPMYQQTETLAPAQQQLLGLANTGALSLGNTAVGMLGQVNQAYQNPITAAGTPGIASGVQNPSGTPGLTGTATPTAGTPGITGQIGTGDYSSQIQQAQNAAYNAQSQYLDPQFSQGQEQLQNQLANQGITQGSQAYNNAMLNFNNQKQQAYQGASDAAVSAGNTEQNTLFNQASTQSAFQNAAQNQGYSQGLSNAGLQNSANSQGYGQGLSSADLQNSAQAQTLQQLFALQQNPLNEYNALATGSQVQQPTFNSVSQANVGNTDVGGITNSAYQNQLAAYQAQLNANPLNQLFSLGGSLGSAAILS